MSWYLIVSTNYYNICVYYIDIWCNNHIYLLYSPVCLIIYIYLALYSMYIYFLSFLVVLFQVSIQNRYKLNKKLRKLQYAKEQADVPETTTSKATRNKLMVCAQLTLLMKLIASSVFSNVYLPSDVLKRLTKWQFLIQNRVDVWTT